MSNGVKTFRVDEDMQCFVDELKTMLNLNDGDEFEMIKTGSEIRIKKSGKMCFLCGSVENVHEWKENRYMCKECAKSVYNAIFEPMSKEEFADRLAK